MSEEKQTNDTSNEAKETATHSADAVKKANDGKNVAIIAHVTLIGWVIALVMNNGDKTELGSFYIRQMLGLIILSIVFAFIPIVGWILNLLMFVLWIMSLIGALSGEKKLTPVLGEHFQKWFSSI